MKTKILVRILVISLAVFCIAFVQRSIQFAQQKTEEPTVFHSLRGHNLSEYTVYELLFRLVDSYNKRDDNQESLGFSQRASALRTHFRRTLRLSDEQTQQLNEIADGFRQEVAALKISKSKLENSIKSEPDGAKNLIELKNLYEKRGRLWLKYRNSLRETFGSEKFERFQKLLQENLAVKIKQAPVTVKQPPHSTAQKQSNPLEVTSFSNSSIQ